jgi:hypothetical protein
MANSYKLGKNAKFYLADSTLSGNTDSDVTGATWTEVDNVRDLTLNMEKEEADITTRGNNGWSQTAATIKDGSVEFEMLWKPGDANFEAIKDAWLNDNEIGAMALDGDKDTSDNQGPAGNWSVTNFSRSEPLREAIKANVTLKPSSQTQWYKVA